MKNIHYMSFFDNEQDCLSAILSIHNNGNDIELDPMYFKGGFYKNGVNRPEIICDINPRVDYCPIGNAESMPEIADKSINCMILDPLFLFGIHGNSETYYTSSTMGILSDFSELTRHYKAILQEAYRVLSRNGVLIFKCQDYTDSKTTMTHCFVYNWATEIGFYAKDIAILNIPQRKIYNSGTTQRHLRKTHCYFWIFIKKQRR